VTPEGEEVDHWESLGIHPHSPKLARFRQTLSGGAASGGFGGGFGGGGFGRGGGFNV
jgi:pilus assembly protein CpaF